MWSVFLTIKTAVSYTYYASFKTGQFIVTSLQFLWTNYLDFLTKLFAVLTVIIEDFTIFLRDVICSVNNIIISVEELCEKLTASTYGALQAIGYLLQLIGNFILTIYTFAINGLIATVNGIKNIFVLLKHVIIMLGDGFWFIVIFIPQSIISLFLSAISYGQSLCVHIIYDLLNYTKTLTHTIVESLYDCYYFLTDVPVESLVGLIIALCFFYIFMQFYSILYNYVHDKFYSFLSGVKRKYNATKRTIVRMLLKRKRNQETFQALQYNPTSTKSIDDAFCIVCQDHPKCILVLPCRHLCLCMECTPRLMRYTGKCPICRKHINSTMKIFT